MTYQLINLLLLGLTTSNSIIYLLKIYFSDLFISSQSIEIEFLFLILGFFVSIPFVLSYESIYKVIKNKLFNQNLQYLIIYLLGINFGFLFSSLFSWSFFSFKLDSFIIQFFKINSFHIFFCLVFMFYFFNLIKLTNKLSILLDSLIFNKKFSNLSFFTSLKTIFYFYKLNLYNSIFFERNLILLDNQIYKLWINFLFNKDPLIIIYYFSILNLLKKQKPLKILIQSTLLKWLIVQKKNYKNFILKVKQQFLFNKTKLKLKKSLIKNFFHLNKLGYEVDEIIKIQLTKKGKKYHQAIGYLEDGSLVVVKNGINFIGYSIRVKIKKIFQTKTGRIIFTNLYNAKN
uniref:TRAM domain-containing protein n=1 Tax=Palmophyllum crassum TaxID=1615899 RepID=A0A1L7NY27_9VIRI|nr:hypothetical protein [Palmophyllum crassum]BAW34818.1 hypothetical protein [Palmophyllum crassum]